MIEILIILGYVVFSTLSVFSVMNMIRQINKTPNEKN
jgi:hypothetical protein